MGVGSLHPIKASLTVLFHRFRKKRDNWLFCFISIIRYSGTYLCVSWSQVQNSEMLAVVGRRAGVEVDTLSPAEDDEGPSLMLVRYFSDPSAPPPLSGENLEVQRGVTPTKPPVSLWQS